MSDNLIRNLANIVDTRFKQYFKDDERVKTIFVVGSMANMEKYNQKKDNDYDIRAVSDVIDRDLIINFNNFLEELSEELTSDNITVGYNTSVGPVNHELEKEKTNFLIHAMIHKRTQLEDFLPLTHKHTYSKNYRIVEGEDCLENFKNVRYALDDILNGHEGLNYCIDMLKKKEHRYLDWDTENGKCEFEFYKTQMPDDTINENCFYSINKFLKNIEQYLEWNNYEVPNDRLEFAVSLLGDKYNIEEVRMFLECVIKKDVKNLHKLARDPIKLTTYILEKCNQRITKEGLDNIYKTKILDNKSEKER